MEYVGVGPRFVALIIDGIILGIISGILSSALPGQYGVSSSITGLLGIAYFTIMEATQGRSVGKMALGLYVVKTDGSPISWQEALVRNILRIVDGLPGFIPFLVGAILVWNSPRKQRLGDRLANTVVIKRR
jgi:uncharacterized RDD family membrane protein YckC